MLRTALAVCGLQLLSSIPTANATEYGARRTLYYQDADCQLETFREFAYEAISIEETGVQSQAGFGECYARGSTGAITTCDPRNGSSIVETYLDTSCHVPLYAYAENTECTSLRVEGETCPPGGPGSATTDCVATEPFDSIHPGPFNLIGSPYKDMHCLQRTGGDHIVSGHAFGVGSGDCSKSPLVRGPRFALTECRADHTVYAQVFGPEDSMCRDEMRLEMVMFPRAESGDRSGGMCALGHFEDGREEYYRLKACTTEDETPKTDIGETPAPTPSVDSGGGSGPDPAPVDYRGDGDDEDLRDDSEDSSDDDDENHADTDDGDGSDRGSSSSSHKDDDKHDREDGHGGGDGDGDSDSDSKEDGSAQGGKDSKDSDSDSDDGLTDDAIFAIAFGVSVAVITCCLSALLALAGSGGEKGKVGPPKTNG
eukprot:g10888.t1